MKTAALLLAALLPLAAAESELAFKDAKKDLLNCGDFFSLTQPKMICDIHRRFLEAGAEETWRKLQLLHRCEIYVCAAAALGLGRGTYLSPFVQRGKMVDHYPTVDLVSDRT